MTITREHLETATATKILEKTMTATAYQAPNAPAAKISETPAHGISWRWLGLWAFLASFAAFEVIKHGFVNGSATEAAILTATAIGFFIAPDLTFIIGAGEPVEKGHLAHRAVPWYNAMHRMWIPLAFTSFIGVAPAPLAFAPLALFIGGLSWMAHIALDRTAGYGLRRPDGSRDLT